jgi:hypothetical protein
VRGSSGQVGTTLTQANGSAASMGGMFSNPLVLVGLAVLAVFVLPKLMK